MEQTFKDRIHSRFNDDDLANFEYVKPVSMDVTTRDYAIEEVTKKVSILLCTIDRYDLTKECVGRALALADYPYELLSTDNGSKDKRVIEYVASLKPVYHNLSPVNLGFPVAMNQMILQASGEYIVLLDNDTAVPHGWLRQLVETYEKIPNTALVALHSLEKLYDTKEINGVTVRPGDVIFGVRFFNRKLFMEKFGCISEAYGVYGIEDRDLGVRIGLAGMHQYYLDNCYAVHMGHDVGENSDYRRMKDACLLAHLGLLEQNAAKYIETKDVFIPFNTDYARRAE